MNPTYFINQRSLVVFAVALNLIIAAIPMVAQTNDRYEGSLDRDAPRGVDTIKFNMPQNRPPEICVIPRHLPFGNYRNNDASDEQQLAHYDFYKIGNTPDDGAVALCPKNKSTSAAVELFNIPKGSTKPQPETPAYCTEMRRTSKDLAKFKQTDNAFTTTCTAANLGYYHVSRVLGDICNIEPAVLRTMDIEQHKQVVKMAADLGIHGTVGKSWNLFNKYYANPRGSSVAQTLFTNDFLQIYGALLKNTRGEEPYADWLRVGINLSATRAFQNMADSRPVKAIVGSTDFSAANVQTFVAMRDMSEMILLDYLLAQSDRLTGGNISDYSKVYYLENNHVKSSRKPDVVPPNVAKVTVKELTIVDTDAGLLNQNVFEQKGYLERICHMHPDTFQRLTDFAQLWKTDPTVKAFFHEECNFSTSQMARFEKYLLNAASTLQARHASGKLLLDLALDDYFHS